MSPEPTLLDWAVGLLLVAGGFFTFVAALGILRLPDVLIRMHASTKAGTLGAGLIFCAVALHFADTVSISFAALTIVFLVITAPVAAHTIGRAAYRMNVRLWERTHLDEWKGQYTPKRIEDAKPEQKTGGSSS
jgi:multicomponent Na+:H+ antiporter subunit G